MSRAFLNSRGWMASVVLLTTVVATGAGLAAWKYTDIAASAAASANQPEPMEVVTAAIASDREHRRTTTSIGTVLALRSITLRNEIAGHGRACQPHAGPDRRARHRARRARRLGRAGRAPGAGGAGGPRRDHARVDSKSFAQHQATSQEEVDQARAAARRRPGADRAHPRAHRPQDDPRAVPRPRRHRRRPPRPVPERGHRAHHAAGRGRAPSTSTSRWRSASPRACAAARQRRGVSPGATIPPIPARIVAIDARVDPTTRNAIVRATLRRRRHCAAPGRLGPRAGPGRPRRAMRSPFR